MMLAGGHNLDHTTSTNSRQREFVEAREERGSSGRQVPSLIVIQIRLGHRRGRGDLDAPKLL